MGGGKTLGHSTKDHRDIMQTCPPPPRDVARGLALAAGLLIALIGLEINAQNVIEVPADQPTIQSAIDAAANGDSVVVAPGTYNEVVNFHGKAIALLSENGPLVTIIDGQQRGSVFTFESGETTSSMVSGFTIRNGNAGANGRFGSAIDASVASPTVVGNIIEASIGGAIWANSSSMVLQRNLIANHSLCSSWGVVAFVNGSSPSIKNNVFINNRCPALSLMLPVGNIPDVANNTFIDNDVGLFVDARVPTNLHRYRSNLFYRNTIGVQVRFGSAANYPTFLNTLAFANTTAFDGMPSPIGSNGNIAADPRLGGITAFDYRPDTGSAAIDAGRNDAVGGGEVDYHVDKKFVRRKSRSGRHSRLCPTDGQSFVARVIHSPRRNHVPQLVDCHCNFVHRKWRLERQHSFVWSARRRTARARHLSI
jgi:Periplasmic copper-binding protein (NosD)